MRLITLSNCGILKFVQKACYFCFLIFYVCDEIEAYDSWIKYRNRCVKIVIFYKINSYDNVLDLIITWMEIDHIIKLWYYEFCTKTSAIFASWYFMFVMKLKFFIQLNPIKNYMHIYRLHDVIYWCINKDKNIYLYYKYIF